MPNSFEPITIKQYNKEVDEASAEEAVGNYITQEEVKKKALTWSESQTQE